MVITHDDDWSSVTKASQNNSFFVQYLWMFFLTFQYDTLLDPHEIVANILASRDIYQENGQIVYNVTVMDDSNPYIICGRRRFLRAEENNK